MDSDVIEKIPIRNLYLIFCYAWNRIEQGKKVAVGVENSPDLLNLLAKLLASGVKQLMRRGFRRDYCSRTEPQQRLGGRVKWIESFPQISRNATELSCESDSLEIDIPSNQVLKATIKRLAQTDGLDDQLVSEMKTLSRHLSSVSDIRLSNTSFNQIQVHRNNADYDFLLRICRLVHQASLPDASGTGYVFTDILRDEVKMARVFEEFVRNFYHYEQDDLEVAPFQIRWDVTDATTTDVALLPIMRTDIHLRNADRALVIDTKYYIRTLQEHFGKQTVHSSNLYQLFAYLKNAEALGGVYQSVEGILLYPVVGYEVDAEMTLQGHRVRIRTVNLARPWQGIRNELLALIQ